MRNAGELRAEANVLMTEHRMLFVTGPRTCRCRASWPCPGWERAEELLSEAHRLEARHSLPVGFARGGRGRSINGMCPNTADARFESDGGRDR